MNVNLPVRDSMVQRVGQCIRKKALIPANSRLLVAVSGGPDSVCLLALLDALGKAGELPGLTLHIGHVNYGLRGRDSNEDEAFVRELASRFGLPVSCERIQLRRASGVSLQDAARNLRYAFFDRVCRAHGLTAIVTGHTADDQAETMLLWLLRGSGTQGLRGIPIVREGRIIRPLLQVGRGEILEYLASRALRYRDDVSNASPTYRRNRIRHELLPRLQEFNPRIIEGLGRTAEILAEDARILDEMEQERWQAVSTSVSSRQIVLDRDRLVSCPLGLQRRMIRRACAALRGNWAGLAFRHVNTIVETILEGRDGWMSLPGRIRVRQSGARVTFERNDESEEIPSWASGVAIPIPGAVTLESGRRIQAEVGAATIVGDPGAGGSTFHADVDRAGETFLVRSWQPGDWFCPDGMGGHRKKLQDFFVDLKIPRDLRHRVPVVSSPEGIVWIVGYRGDERFRATPKSSAIVRFSDQWPAA
jgi:tRNA(Ile)-lysidine synthase